jgi:hypothetical protein
VSSKQEKCICDSEGVSITTFININLLHCNQKATPLVLECYDFSNNPTLYIQKPIFE